jgi:nucleoside-diphosphate-sugar epimerase
VRVIVVGATGTVGREVLAGLANHKAINDVISLSDVRSAEDRAACAELGIEYRSVNLREDLSTQFRYSDAIVYAGWPTSGSEISRAGHRFLKTLDNVCDSAARAHIKAFVYGSSAFGYSEEPTRAPVDEQWPFTGAPWSPGSLQIAQGEQLVDEFEAKHEIIRVVALRPALIVCPSQAPTSWRERVGKRVLRSFVAGGRIRVVPDLGAREIQMVHVSDLVDAFCLAVTGSVVGRFNLATDPITSDMLAEEFRAKLRIPLAAARKVHSYARHVGLAASDPEVLRLSLQLPPLSTARALGELGWLAKHSGAAVVAEWRRSLAATDTHRAPSEPAVGVSVPVDSLQEIDYESLYQWSLDLFGREVHAIRDDQWTEATEYQGFNVWQLVASVASQQYEIALLLRSDKQHDTERQIPDDPLGFSRADGWDLAAERGLIALRECQEASVIERMLPDVICDMTLRGWFLAQAIGFEATANPELSHFVEQRMREFTGASTNSA